MDLLDTGFTLADINKYCPELIRLHHAVSVKTAIMQHALMDAMGRTKTLRNRVITRL